MNLKDLLVEEKLVTVDYPGCEGFSITLAFLGKKVLGTLRTKATITRIDKKSRQPVEEIDSELFTKLYIDAVVKGWSGLKYKYLVNLLPIDISSVDEEAELEYSVENARVLLKDSGEFDTWVAEVVGDLQNFTKAK